MIVSSRSLAAQISSTLMRPCAVSICASMPTRDCAPGDLLDLGEQHVERLDLGGRLHLGQHELVEPLGRAFDDVDDVAVRPLGVPRVDPHAQDRVAPVELVDRVARSCRATLPSRAARRRLRGRGTPCRRRARAPCPASSRWSRAPRGTSGGAGCGSVRTCRKRTDRGAPATMRPSGDPSAAPTGTGAWVGVAGADRRSHELADGVYVWLQPGGESGVSNAGVVVDDDGLTVVDTLMVRSQWEPFVEAVNGLGRPVRRIAAHACAHRPRRRHDGVPERGGVRVTADEPAARRRDAARRVQGVHARVRRRVRRPRRARHAPGDTSRRPTPRSSRLASRCCRQQVTPPAT